MGEIITLTMAMRHCRRAIAAWPLSFKSQPIRAVIPIAFDRSTSGRSFFSNGSGGECRRCRVDKAVPLLSVPFGGRFMQGVKRCVSPWPFISAVELRSEAASALRASSRNMAVAVGRFFHRKR